MYDEFIVLNKGIMFLFCFVTGGVCQAGQCGEGPEAVLSANQQQDIFADICKDFGGAQAIQNERQSQCSFSSFSSPADKNGICYRVSESY